MGMKHAGLGDAGLGGHRAHAPVRRPALGLGVQGRLDQLRHALIVNGARRARANVVAKTCDASLDEARAPLTHRGLGQPQSLGDRIVRFTLSATENDACPAAQRRQQRAAACEQLQLRTRLLAQHQIGFRSACLHRGISVPKIPHWHAILMPVICRTGHLDVAFAQRQRSRILPTLYLQSQIPPVVGRTVVMPMDLCGVASDAMRGVKQLPPRLCQRGRYSIHPAPSPLSMRLLRQRREKIQSTC